MMIDKNKVSETHRLSISENGEIISRLYIRDKQDNKPVCLFRLKTNKSHRRKGLASELIKLAIDRYKFRGITLRSCSQKDGPSITALMKMYRKFGFIRKGKTQTMYIDPPRKWKKGDRTKVECLNCGNYMTITPMSYSHYYTHGYDDNTTCIDSKYDEKAMECKKCKFSHAGGQMVKFKGFSTNHWSKEKPLKQWIDDINNGKGINRIRYD